MILNNKQITQIHLWPMLVYLMGRFFCFLFCILFFSVYSFVRTFIEQYNNTIPWTIIIQWILFLRWERIFISSSKIFSDFSYFCLFNLIFNVVYLSFSMRCLPILHLKSSIYIVGLKRSHTIFHLNNPLDVGFIIP